MQPPSETTAPPDQRFAFLVNGVRHVSPDARVDGRTILRLAGFNPASDHVLIQLTNPGSRSVGLDESVDLSPDGREIFRAFHSDRAFNFTVDELGYEWGASTISEAELRAITGAADNKHFVLERQGEPDQPIHEGEMVALGERGTEHLRTVRALTTIIVNAEKKEVERRRISFEALVKLAFETPPTGENILITIDYGNGPPANPKGSLKPGETVKIKNKMVFDVTATDRS